MALQLIINGRPETLGDLDPGASLSAALAALGLKSDRVAIERNGEITPRSAWPVITLEPGDRLEIVHFVGGGAPAITCRQEALPARMNQRTRR